MVLRNNAKPIFIHNKLFNTRAAAKRYIQYIVKNEKLNQPISDENKEFVNAILEYHPYCKDKIGCGVEYIFVRINPEYGRNREFCIKRIDGSIEDFSWHYSIKENYEERNENA
mgnify:CR=1 FL=1